MRALYSRGGEHVIVADPDQIVFYQLFGGAETRYGYDGGGVASGAIAPDGKYIVLSIHGQTGYIFAVGER